MEDVRPVGQAVGSQVGGERGAPLGIEGERHGRAAVHPDTVAPCRPARLSEDLAVKDGVRGGRRGGRVEQDRRGLGVPRRREGLQHDLAEFATQGQTVIGREAVVDAAQDTAERSLGGGLVEAAEAADEVLRRE